MRELPDIVAAYDGLCERGSLHRLSFASSSATNAGRVLAKDKLTRLGAPALSGLAVIPAARQADRTYEFTDIALVDAGCARTTKARTSTGFSLL